MEFSFGWKVWLGSLVLAGRGAERPHPMSGFILKNEFRFIGSLPDEFPAEKCRGGLWRNGIRNEMKTHLKTRSRNIRETDLKPRGKRDMREARSCCVTYSTTGHEAAVCI